MENYTEQIGGRECRIYINTIQKEQPKEQSCCFLLIQPVDDNDLAVMEEEWQAIQAACPSERLVLAAFKIADWNLELTPWEAPPVWGSQGYRAGAQQTLDYVEKDLLPVLRERYTSCPQDSETMLTILGGYSLAGLFALWSGYQASSSAAVFQAARDEKAAKAVSRLRSEQSGPLAAPMRFGSERIGAHFQTSAFNGIAAVSPSVWYPKWMDYASDHVPLSQVIYLSLGDKEEKTRNQTMARVGSCIREQYALLQRQGKTVTLEWNQGNHFRDTGIRTAKGFIWTIQQLIGKKQS